MLNVETTTTLLLDGLRDARNETAWREFYGRYMPIIVCFSRKLGLDDADAADVAHDTLACFVREYRDGKYDRERGRLRSWIIAIVQSRVACFKRDQARRHEVRGQSAINDLPAESQLTKVWEAEHRRVIVQRALADLHSHTRLAVRTIRAFERLVIDERPAAEVAAELGITPADVYVAKHRVAKHLRRIVTRLQALYDEG